MEKDIRNRLFALQDAEYREFHCKLIPTVNPETVIGVRTPELRKFSREFAKTPEAAEFLKLLPHSYYEENNLHGFVIETIRDYETAIAAVDLFLPFIDNWATCDLMSPKVFKKHLPELYGKIPQWLESGKTYTIRFGIGMLLRFFLDDAFRPEMLELVAAVQSDEYYVNMMIAWYFATALTKQYNTAAPYIIEQRLSAWTHNKTIQKAIESFRITDETKRYLRSLKVQPRTDR
jgi:3-methyladenine DNA glycosylase AlkD